VKLVIVRVPAPGVRLAPLKLAPFKACVAVSPDSTVLLTNWTERSAVPLESARKPWLVVLPTSTQSAISSVRVPLVAVTLTPWVSPLISRSGSRRSAPPRAGR